MFASKPCLLVLCLFFQAALLPAGDIPTGIPADMHGKIESILKRFEVPGAGVAVVKDGRVVFARGYGVRELGKPEKVDEHTLFGIASNSKAFTAACLAMLVDDGLISWEDPVVKHLPDFRMYDPFVSAELTIEDLLVHRSGLGLGAGDLLHWPQTQYTPAEIVQRLRYIKPKTSFRAKYAYDNVLYLVAGQVIERVSGRPWVAFVQERIFQPLGMIRANASESAFLADANRVSPHAKLDGVVQTIPHMGLDNVAPAGAVNASVHEMTFWLQTQLAGGRFGETRLFSEGQARRMHTIVTPMPIRKPPAALAALEANFRGYGLGWSIQDYRGFKMVSHNGGLLGQVSKVALLPKEHLGVVVLTNQQSGAAFEAVTYTLFDYFLKITEPTDWEEAYAGRLSHRSDELKKFLAEREAARKPEVGPSLSLSHYAGRYRDAWYGDMTLTEEQGKLVMRFAKTPMLTGDLEHYQYDTFLVRWHERSLEADAFVSFALTPTGEIDQVKMEAYSPATDFSFNFQDLLFQPLSP